MICDYNEINIQNIPIDTAPTKSFVVGAVLPLTDKFFQKLHCCMQLFVLSEGYTKEVCYDICGQT